MWHETIELQGKVINYSWKTYACWKAESSVQEVTFLLIGWRMQSLTYPCPWPKPFEQVKSELDTPSTKSLCGSRRRSLGRDGKTSSTAGKTYDECNTREPICYRHGQEMCGDWKLRCWALQHALGLDESTFIFLRAGALSPSSSLQNKSSKPVGVAWRSQHQPNLWLQEQWS